MNIAKIVLGILIFLIAGGWALFSKVVLVMDYVAVNAVITSTKTDCYLIPKDRSDQSYRYRTRAYSCSDYENKLRVRSKHRIRYRIRTTFNYVSPVDGSTYSGNWARDGLRQLKKPSIGDRITIHAHKQDPAKFSADL